jgi:signal transduction histidine kinase
VLSNLLDNAIKFAPRRPIHVKLTTEAGNAVLVLRDHGEGIPPERLHEIFEPYKRGVPARHFGGLGLGLYVVRAIVEAHGGTASVESWPGEGTAFTLTLPVSVPVDAAPAA